MNSKKYLIMKNMCALLLLCISTVLQGMQVPASEVPWENVDETFDAIQEHAFIDYVQQKIGVTLSQPLSTWNSSPDVLDRKNQILLIASKYGYIPAIEILLNRGAHVNVCNCKNYAPLHYAVKKRNYTLVQFLIDHGAHVDLIGPKWEHPIQTAVQSGDIKMVQLLLKNHCGLNMRHYLSHSPLERAIEHGYPEIAQLLLNYGAEIFPHYISLAKQYGRSEVLLMLKKSKQKRHVTSCALL